MTKRLRETEIDLWKQLNLTGVGELVLNRVFDRDDIDVFFLYGLQCGVERRCFAGTGRPSHQNNAVAAPDQVEKTGLVRRFESNVFNRAQSSAFVEHANHDAFAVLHRNDRHPQIDHFFCNLQANATVLWQPPLSDVERRQNFDTAYDRRQQRSAKTSHRHQRSVNAKQHFKFVFSGPQMQVGRAHAHGVVKQRIHQVHNRRALGHMLRVAPNALVVAFGVALLLHGQLV